MRSSFESHKLPEKIVSNGQRKGEFNLLGNENASSRRIYILRVKFAPLGSSIEASCSLLQAHRAIGRTVANIKTLVAGRGDGALEVSNTTARNKTSRGNSTTNADSMRVDTPHESVGDRIAEDFTTGALANLEVNGGGGFLDRECTTFKTNQQRQSRTSI